MNPEFLITQFGYLGLFIISLVAASIIPLSSEVFVLAMPAMGFNVWLVGLVATAGNFTGALTVYYMGKKGTEYLLAKYPRLDGKRLTQAENWFHRWGAPVLLLAGLPIIGDPICLVAGTLHMKFWTFSLWTFIGKGWRYVLLLGFWNSILNWWGWFG